MHQTLRKEKIKKVSTFFLIPGRVSFFGVMEAEVEDDVVDLETTRHIVPGTEDERYGDNRIDNSRYSAVSFLPKVLALQFRSLLNVYFLILAILQLIPGLSPTNAAATWVPLLVILSVGAAREAMDDLGRRRRDRVFNSRPYLLPNGTRVPSGSLKVGTLFMVLSNEEIPCDAVAIRNADESSSTTPQRFFIQTSQLDGEADFKERWALANVVSIRVPHIPPSLHSVSPIGSFLLSSSPPVKNPLLPPHFLPQGSVSRAGVPLLCCCIRSGPHASLGRPIPIASRRTLLDRRVDTAVAAIFIVQMILAFAGGTVGTLAARAMAPIYLWPNGMEGGFSMWIQNVARVGLLMSMMIPVSLRVVLETGRYALCWWVEQDRQMWSEELQKGAQCNATGTLEEAGSLQYGLFDKTGTLTKNEMRLEQLYADSSVTTEKDILRAVVLCSTVRVDRQTYSASSPDELALIEGARERGVVLQRREGTLTDVSQERWDTVDELTFSSARRRMTVIVSDSNTMWLISKGADDALQPLCRSDSWERSGVVRAVQRSCEEGLRVLVVAWRKVSKEELQESGLLEARRSTRQDREEQVEAAYKKLERNMTCVGMVGIRDQLQDGVADTLRSLRAAGLRLWVLTGDKGATAASVCYATGLWRQREATLEPDGERALNAVPPGGVLHITGTQASAWCNQYPEAFLRAAQAAQSVLCSRCSPSDKAAVTSFLVRSGGRVLAVGDGGNDVHMLREASFGIGLSGGREGSQAALAADVSVPLFRHVSRIVLWHSRLALLRLSFMAHYCVFKSQLVALCQLIFAACSLFSGVSLFSSSALLLYNVVFTGMPIMTRLEDMDATPYSEAQVPSLRSFGGWIARAVCQALVVFGVCVLAHHSEGDMVTLGTTVYLCLVLVANLTLLLEANTINVHLLVVVVGLIPLLWIVLYILSLTPRLLDYGAFSKMLVDASFWFTVLLVLAVALLPVFVLKYMQGVQRAWLFKHRYEDAKASDDEMRELVLESNDLGL